MSLTQMMVALQWKPAPRSARSRVGHSEAPRTQYRSPSRKRSRLVAKPARNAAKSSGLRSSLARPGRCRWRGFASPPMATFHGGSVKSRCGALRPHQAVHGRGVGAIAAQQPVAAQVPKVARLRERLCRRLDLVDLRCLAAPLRDAQAGELVAVESGQGEVEVEARQLVQLEVEQLVLPRGLLCRAVVGQAIRLRLRRREARGDVDGYLLEAQLLRRQEPRVPHQHEVLSVDDDGLTPAELPQRARHLGDGHVWGDARVVLVGPRSVYRPHLNRELRILRLRRHPASFARAHRSTSPCRPSCLSSALLASSHSSRPAFRKRSSSATRASASALATPSVRAA